jgi:hypothetical protein
VVLTVAVSVTEVPVVTLFLDKAIVVVVAAGVELVFPPLELPPPEEQPGKDARTTNSMQHKMSEP